MNPGLFTSLFFLIIVLVFFAFFVFVFLKIFKRFSKGKKITPDIKNNSIELLKSRVSEEGIPKQDIFKTNTLYMKKLRSSYGNSRKYQRYQDIYNSLNSKTPSCISESHFNIAPNNVNGFSVVQTNKEKIEFEIINGEIEAFLNERRLGVFQTKRSLLNEQGSSDYVGYAVYPFNIKDLYSLGNVFKLERKIKSRGIILKFRDRKQSKILLDQRVYLNPIKNLKNLKNIKGDKLIVARLDSKLSKEQRIFTIGFLLILRANQLISLLTR